LRQHNSLKVWVGPASDAKASRTLFHQATISAGPSDPLYRLNSLPELPADGWNETRPGLLLKSVGLLRTRSLLVYYPGCNTRSPGGLHPPSQSLGPTNGFLHGSCLMAGWVPEKEKGPIVTVAWRPLGTRAHVSFRSTTPGVTRDTHNDPPHDGSHASSTFRFAQELNQRPRFCPSPKVRLFVRAN
jgi:hypothetical protein